jgi:hypothetical protein
VLYSNDQQRLQYIGSGVPEEAVGKAPRAETPRARRHAAALGKILKEWHSTPSRWACITQELAQPYTI